MKAKLCNSFEKKLNEYSLYFSVYVGYDLFWYKTSWLRTKKEERGTLISFINDFFPRTGMVLKLINATSCGPGTTFLYEGKAVTVISNDISKTGKHGASKCRMECREIFTGKKKIIAVPGDNRFDVPLIQKRRAQVLGLVGTKVSIMDLENFETLELAYDEEIKDKLLPEAQVEYWDVESQEKVVMRVF
ncbi:translation initiation factor IF-5A [Candidatus Pacearchaeota archaeon]|nr:translation initiation factor IF-5A [Candidatus Pacearchaeota archaeon]